MDLLSIMAGFVSVPVQRALDVAREMQALATRLATVGQEFPGSVHRPADRKVWMAELGPENVSLHQVVWPGSHNSATNEIGIPLVTRPFAQCQSLSVYEQLVMGCRLLDVRVQRDSLVCHGPLATYHVDVVLADVKRFLAETESEVLVLEIRTEFDHDDPPDFAAYLVEQLGEHLIPQNEAVFLSTIANVLPRRVICVWKPRNSPTPSPEPGSPLWSASYLTDNWMNTDLPETKFDNNITCLGQQPKCVADRRYFYRVENTVTPQADSLVLFVEVVTGRIHGYARLFIAEVFAGGLLDKLQVFSTDFIDGDFVDACAGVTHARVQGIA